MHGKNLVPQTEKYTYFDFVKQNNLHYEKDLKIKLNFGKIIIKIFKN